MNIAERNEPVATNALKIMKQKGLKQVYVAKKAGYKKQQFNDMVNGRKLIKPCDALAISEAHVGIYHPLSVGKGNRGTCFNLGFRILQGFFPLGE